MNVLFLFLLTIYSNIDTANNECVYNKNLSNKNDKLIGTDEISDEYTIENTRYIDSDSIITQVQKIIEEDLEHKFNDIIDLQVYDETNNEEKAEYKNVIDQMIVDKKIIVKDIIAELLQKVEKIYLEVEDETNKKIINLVQILNKTLEKELLELFEKNADDIIALEKANSGIFGNLDKFAADEELIIKGVQDTLIQQVLQLSIDALEKYINLLQETGNEFIKKFGDDKAMSHIVSLASKNYIDNSDKTRAELIEKITKAANSLASINV